MEDFSDTMWDVTKGRDLNVGPTGAEAAHNGSLLCDLFSQQHPEAYCGCFKKIENYGQGNQLIPKTIACEILFILVTDDV